MNQFNQQFITAIIDRYGLEPDDYQIDNIVVIWLKTYDRAWIVKAIVESLHRGRYKIKSVDSILSVWQRAGKPAYNFPPEFEREILQNLPTISDLAATQAPPALPQLDDVEPAIRFPGLSSDQLNPEESAPFPHHDCYRSGASPFSLRRRYALAEPALCAYGKAIAGANAPLPPTTRRFPPSCVRQDRRQAVRATPLLQPPTLDLGTTFPRPESDCPVSLTPPSVSSFRGEDDVNLHHINSHPKFQLFHTLRAIITPHNLPATGLDDLEPPSYSTDLA
jgi:hypothetical protein